MSISKFLAKGGRNLPKGAVNEEGQSFEEWLENLRKKYNSGESETALVQSAMETLSVGNRGVYWRSARNFMKSFYGLPFLICEMIVPSFLVCTFQLINLCAI